MNTSLSYQLRAARRKPADFKSGEIVPKLCRNYEGIIRGQKRKMEKTALGTG
ncbi:MAG: hypothetical protein K2N95_01770 [Lachnospiraceae bacterium]|nr:hypothetical protein [Lachnospiraceae bacterium]